jgi:DNA sulfur modification protein DndD
MILNEIMVRNYGVYHGTHRADLTPIDGKPVILFGGLNGGGKTTLLDAFQLALYGAKGRLSNRGRLGYRDYLKQCINRNARHGDWAEVQLTFTKVLTGKLTQFTVTRSWRETPKGISEELSVSLNGITDPVFTEHWDEIVDTYLPSSISHLFFFDGEQIAALAEQSSAASILGIAVNSLLGLDLVDRLQADLKVFERRKQATALDATAATQLKALNDEREAHDRLEDALVTQRGELENELGRLRKSLGDKEADFRSRGGLAFEKQQELRAQLNTLSTEKQIYEEQLRQLAAGALPAALVANEIERAAFQAKQEVKAHQARVMANVLEQRDAELLETMKQRSLPAPSVAEVAGILAADRASRAEDTHCEVILEADDDVAACLQTLSDVTLPEALRQTEALVAKMAATEERLARIEADLARVPELDAVADVVAAIRTFKAQIESKTPELDSLVVRLEAARRRSVELEEAIQQLADEGLAAQQAEDSRLRILKHSKKVRSTLDAFRISVISQQSSRSCWSHSGRFCARNTLFTP